VLFGFEWETRGWDIDAEGFSWPIQPWNEALKTMLVLPDGIAKHCQVHCHRRIFMYSRTNILQAILCEAKHIYGYYGSSLSYVVILTQANMPKQYLPLRDRPIALYR
jgi:hypothetical protein